MAEIPLTAFEEYMLCDDRPDHPMTGVVRLRFSGLLSVPGLEAALNIATERHPLLRFRVVRKRLSRLCWVQDPAFSVEIEQLSDARSEQYPPVRYIDLTQQSGTRFWLIDRGTRHELVMQMHHSCTDALGVCRFIEDLVLAYVNHNRQSTDQIPLPALDHSRLNHRCRFGRCWSQVLRLLPGLVMGLPNVWAFFRRNATRLHSGDIQQLPVDQQLPLDFPATQNFEFDSETTQRILLFAKQRGVTVNDLMARDLFLTLVQWAQQQQCLQPHEWVCLAVPVSLRLQEDARASAANRISLQFLHCSPSCCKNPDQLLASIHEHMNQIKKYDLGFLFISFLALVRRLPGGLRSMVPADKCLSSCIFTNLGVILRSIPLPRNQDRLDLDGVTLDSVDFIPPLRPNTSAAFCVYSYAGRLTLLLHYNSRAISPCQAGILLKTYCDTLRQCLR